MKKLFIKCLRVFGYIWLFSAILLILAGYIGTWMEEGFSGVQRLLSPFNIPNWIVTIITLAPGLGAISIADKFSKNV